MAGDAPARLKNEAPVFRGFFVSEVKASIQDAAFGKEPGVDDLPLVAPAWPEVQQRRPLVLKIVEELQGVSGGRGRRIDVLVFKPTIPFDQDQGFPYVSSH